MQEKYGGQWLTIICKSGIFKEIKEVSFEMPRKQSVTTDDSSKDDYNSYYFNLEFEVLNPLEIKNKYFDVEKDSWYSMNRKFYHKNLKWISLDFAPHWFSWAFCAIKLR